LEHRKFPDFILQTSIPFWNRQKHQCRQAFGLDNPSPEIRRSLAEIDLPLMFQGMRIPLSNSPPPFSIPNELVYLPL
jgi:hypothetical protein